MNNVICLNAMRKNKVRHDPQSENNQIIHDLKSPLQVLKNIIDDSSLTHTEKRIAQMAFSRVCHLTKSIENHSIPSNKKKDSLSKILSEIIQEKEKEHKINFTFLSSLKEEDIIHCCSQEIKRAISNLINNSVEALATNINIHLLKNKKQLKLIIADNGEGFPPEKKEDLLEAGVSGKKSSGLGLSIAKDIFNRNNFNFNICSSPEIGTFVTISSKE